MKVQLISACIIAIILFTSYSVEGQIISSRRKYRHPFDQKKFNFGFQMGLNYNDYKFKQAYGVWDKTGTAATDLEYLDNIEMKARPGFTLGMITNLNLHNNLNIRFIPAISLEQRDFTYYITKPKNRIEQRHVEAAILDLPLLVQVKSDYYKRYRLYVLAGPELSINFQSNKRIIDDPTQLKVEKTTFNFVTGVGFNLYGERIKLSPELRYSVGLTNDYVPLNTTFPTAVGSLFRQVITFHILFE